MTINDALSRLVSRPLDLVVHRWNWKAAFFSSIVRGVIFLLANLSAVTGLFVDSLLGATFERWGWLNNDAVNFLATVTAAATGLALSA